MSRTKYIGRRRRRRSTRRDFIGNKRDRRRTMRNIRRRR